MVRKILVIEDEKSLRNDIMEMLRYEGYGVIGAGDGVEGIEQAQRQLPDLIICDIMMPDVDGFDVLKALRGDTLTAPIPFIFLTARTDRLDHRLGMAEGADDFLTKPFTVNELLVSIRTRLERRAAIERESERRLEMLRGNIILAMPHELRTPLTAILGFSDILGSDIELETERIREMARHINKAALRLFHLVENYLVYAQVETSLTDQDFLQAIRTVEVNDAHILIEDTAIQKAQAHNREADLRLDVSPAKIAVLDTHLKKVVEELVDNAFKFSEPGRIVQVSATANDQRFLLQISDQGMGLTPDQIRDVGAYMQFNRRLHEQQGAGLGLIIAKRIAQLHNGSLTIESIPGQETTVTVALRCV